jgi:hypothetical protein
LPFSEIRERLLIQRTTGSNGSTAGVEANGPSGGSTARSCHSGHEGPVSVIEPPLIAVK